MNGRKQHVVRAAHQLFMDKGFQATSIQDILEYGGISKGTFYNYFASKNELFMELFKMLYFELIRRQDELLIGQNRADIDVFIRQIELQMEMSRANKMNTLYEEVMFSNDAELRQFIRNGNLRILRWYYQRFLDLFGESKKPYLLDCAVMFAGILHQLLKYHTLAYNTNTSIQRIVRYSVERIVRIVHEVADSGTQLLPPDLLDRWLPDGKPRDHAFQHKLCHTVADLRKTLHPKDQSAFVELLDFLQDELLHTKEPRKFLIDSALLSLKTAQVFAPEELGELEQLVSAYFERKKDADGLLV